MSNFADVHASSRFAADKMKKNNLFTTDRLFCDVYCFEPGQAQTPHSHSGSDKVYYVIEGTARIRIGSDEREVGAGVGGPGTGRRRARGHQPRPGRLKLLVLMAPKP